MSATYVVIAVKNGCELEICEAYAGSNAALGRAFSLAHLRSFLNKETLIPVPTEIKSEDGSIRWVFISTDKTYVAVHYQNILVYPLAYEPLKNSVHPDPVPAPATVTLNQAVIDPIVTFDDPYEDTLPGGWWEWSNKPATMKDLWEKPGDIKPMFFLTTPQKWALARARIAKRPNYHLDIPGLGIFDQTRALKSLDAKNIEGEEIMEDEIQWLEEVRNDRYDVILDT